VTLPTTVSTEERANTGPDSAANEAYEKPLAYDKRDATSVVREMAEPRGHHSDECPEPYRGESRPDYESIKGAAPRCVHVVTVQRFISASISWYFVLSQ
jgi:hypothetical protein